jgi:hypothetical protein
VAARDRLYGATMGSDHEAEIRASVSAHQDLGPGYDDAVAEGLVERIGAEIDKRIDAQLRRYGPPFGPQVGPDVPSSGVPGAWQPPASPGPADPTPPGVPLGYPTSAGYLPAGYPAYPGYQGYSGYQGYPGYPGYQAPMMAPGYQAPAPGVHPAAPSVGPGSLAMTVMALGSMSLGVVATAILAHDQGGGGRAVLALVIWVAIAIVNIAYARRR